MSICQRIVLGFILSSVIPTTSFACKCIPFDAEKKFSNSLYVFEAYLTNSQIVENLKGTVGPWGAGNNRMMVTGNFYASKIWKGNPNSLQGVITISESSACGISLAAGETYLFFVSEKWVDEGLLIDDEYGIVSICAGPYLGDYELYQSTIEWLNNRKH